MKSSIAASTLGPGGSGLVSALSVTSRREGGAPWAKAPHRAAFALPPNSTQCRFLCVLQATSVHIADLHGGSTEAI